MNDTTETLVIPGGPHEDVDTDRVRQNVHFEFVADRTDAVVVVFGGVVIVWLQNSLTHREQRFNEALYLLQEQGRQILSKTKKSL